MTVVARASPEVSRAQPAGPPAVVRVGLLGLGQVGAAVAAHWPCARAPSGAPASKSPAALVRDPPPRRAPRKGIRPRPTLKRVQDSADVIVEVLGGIEPARTLVLDAIARGIPVVTANKSLVAHHGDELAEAAARAGVPLPLRGERRLPACRSSAPLPAVTRTHRRSRRSPASSTARRTSSCRRCRTGRATTSRARRCAAPRFRRTRSVEGRRRHRCRSRSSSF